jgi:membrane-bound lytic murein transglycosylase D
MNFLSPLTFYLAVATLLSFSAIVLYSLNHYLDLRFQDLLKISKLLVIASLFLPILALTLPKDALMPPHVQVFSSGMKKTQNTLALVKIVRVAEAPRMVKREPILFLTALFLSATLIQITLFIRRFLRLRRVLENSHVIKKIGTTLLLTTAEVSSPFSCWNFRSNIVVIPTGFLERREDLRIALQHEFQHHRSGDTRWVYLFELLKIIFYWNPFTYLFISQTLMIQEFACDEFLIGHQKISPEAYGGCLMRTAESAVHSQLILVGTASMAGKLGSSILKRRIKMLFKTQHQTSKFTVAAISVIVFTLMASLAYASKSAVQERKLTLEQARVYADKAAKNSAIPIDLNDLVLEKLNYFIGTAKGRSWVSGGLSKMKTYQKMIDLKTAQLGLPQELIAMPLFESAFQNDVVSSHKAAGIWQFIPATAQHYNLIVDEKTDDRLNPEKETEAAMTYLSYLKDDFHDWRLAIKAYNEGEHQVQALIDQLGTKDAWVIEHSESKEAYLSGVIAMMIVLKNPELQN